MMDDANKPLRGASADHVQTEAAAWLARLDAAEGMPEQHAALQTQCAQWRLADPGHNAAWLRLASIFGRLDRLSAVRPAPGKRADADLLAAGAQLLAAASELHVGADSNKVVPIPTRAANDAASTSARAPRRFGITRYAQAAGLALVIGIGAGLLVVHDPAVDYATQVGERRNIQLQDNSVIALNTQSKVSVKYEANSRQIDLRQGEAHFTVAKNSARPFIVTANGMQIRAVGTAFLVRTKGSAVEVVVTEGTVAVYPVNHAEQGRQLTAGSIGVFGAGGQQADERASGVAPRTGEVQPAVVRVASTAEISRKMAWETGMLAFDGDSLQEAVAEFNRYNTNKLVIAEPDLNVLRVGGYFRANDVTTFVSALRASFGIEAYAGAEGVTYLRKAKHEG